MTSSMISSSVYRQNNAARLVLRTPKHEHVTTHFHAQCEVRRELLTLASHQSWDWIQLQAACLIMFQKCTLQMSPLTYSSDLLVPYTPSKALRSSSSNNRRSIARVHRKGYGYGEGAFSVAGPPSIWNSLPPPRSSAYKQHEPVEEAS